MKKMRNAETQWERREKQIGVETWPRDLVRAGFRCSVAPVSPFLPSWLGSLGTLALGKSVVSPQVKCYPGTRPRWSAGARVVAGCQGLSIICETGPVASRSIPGHGY
ncbi:hypothetical protein Pmani_028953 [Petrolisthes manimaculis]|uniref:Uncharacterized protein n=1 Tax=Petrolisthes manimaculis TaxID=1843537 RepID=A0AAE1NYI6_9EUCA|nr:hypothetical protein Pmani_028953 [Petrolisthes manimaculis]